MTQQTRTLQFPASDTREVEYLKESLLSQGFSLRTVEHSVLAGIRAAQVVTLYKTGRLVIQGQDIDDLIQALGLGHKPAKSGLTKSSAFTLPRQEPWIGTDESGKGDYFGPLVVAGVRLDSTSAAKIATLGARDSKTLSDAAIRRLGLELINQVPNAVVVIGPERYNQLYTEMQNVNTLLAWGHARCIENILEKSEAVLAIADQFGDEKYIKSALMHRGRTLKLEQRPHAEEDLAVASASILARLEFVTRLERLSREAGFELPKGAGKEVEEVARRLVASKGVDALSRFAKIHFRTTARVVQ